MGGHLTAKDGSTDFVDAEWKVLEALIPGPTPTGTQGVVNAISYLLRSGCQWHDVKGVPGVPVSECTSMTRCGESYEVQITGANLDSQRNRRFYITLDGVPQEVDL